MEKPTILYHVTERKNLDSIFEKGLIVQAGNHCKQKGDIISPAVFLCSEKDIEHWLHCFYNVDIVLKVDVRDKNLCFRDMRTYIEYGCLENIEPARISIYRELEKSYNIK